MTLQKEWSTLRCFPNMDGRMWKNVKDKSVVKNLKAITSFEELEKVLKYIQNMQSENIRTLVSEQFDMLLRL